MSEPLEQRLPPEEKPYGLDELVRHEKRQSLFTALLLVGAVVLTLGRQLTYEGAGPELAPVASGAATGSSAR